MLERNFSIALFSDCMSIGGSIDDINYIIDNWIEEKYIVEKSIINGDRKRIVVEADSDKLYRILSNITSDLSNTVNLC